MKKPAKTKPTLAWVAVSPSGFIAKWTARTTRGDCLSAITVNLREQTWKQAYRDGWRVVRVEIREVK